MFQTNSRYFNIETAKMTVNDSDGGIDRNVDLGNVRRELQDDPDSLGRSVPGL